MLLTLGPATGFSNARQYQELAKKALDENFTRYTPASGILPFVRLFVIVSPKILARATSRTNAASRLGASRSYSMPYSRLSTPATRCS
jgi:hypothetical protein